MAPHAGTPLLTLRAVTKKIRAGTSLHGLSLVVGNTDIITLVGPGGSGKTLALLIAARLLAPDQGEVIPASDASIVFLPSPPPFPPAGQGREDKLAAALATHPRLLILDDQGQRGDFARLLLQYRAAHPLAVLLATTDPPTALSLSDRIIVLDGGIVRQAGTPREVYEHPATPRVAGLIGPVNMLTGVVRDVDDDDSAEVVLPGGGIVEAQAIGTRPGAACSLCVRPERVALALGDDDGLRGISGAIAALTYFGAYVSVRVALDDGSDFLVHRPAPMVTARLREGARVTLAWQAIHARAFPVQFDETGSECRDHALPP